MFNSKQLDDLATKLFSILPASLQNFEQEVQQQFKDVLQAGLSKLDLVTRDEFDVQCKVLARTREKLESLEKQFQDVIAKKD